jgi:outer membrane protein
MKKIIFIISILFTAGMIQAQKFGHINTQTLLLELPEYQSAQIELENFGKEKMAEFEQYKVLYKDKEIKYLANETKSKADPNSYPAELLKQDYQKLMESAQKLEDLQYEIQDEIQERESILLNGIINKIKLACEAVAKEKGYTYIFDISSLLFAGGEDLNEAVKVQLSKMRLSTTTTTPVAPK